jgi:dipeptidyl aminopeptidase/acylaminoacyl peptidase
VSGGSREGRLRWLARLGVLVLLAAGGASLPQARAQDAPVRTIDEEITAFAYAPDGRIVYAVRRLFKTKKYDLQRDDIWIEGTDGKRRRVVQGEKFMRGSAPFSYTVNGFRWSADGRRIVAELFTTAVVDAEGNTRDLKQALLLDDTGKEIRIRDGDSLIPDGNDAAWLADEATVVYLAEAVKPHLLYSIQTMRPAAGRGGPLFAGRTFVDADWIAKTGTGIVIERDRALSGPPRIQRLDLVKEADTELATLDGYAGGLEVSPSGTKAAYYIDHEVLEIRDLTAPNRIARLRVGFGAFQWAPDEKRILLKRAPERKAGELVWIDVPPLIEESAKRKEADGGVVQPALAPIFHGLSIHDFQISPDGRFLAVVAPGKGSLVVYPLAAAH